MTSVQPNADTADRVEWEHFVPDNTVLATGLRFPEGPVALDDGSLIVVEIARGTITRIDTDGSVEVVAHTGGGPNGAAIGPDGWLYVCNNGGFVWHEVNGLLLPGDQPDDYVGGSIQRVNLDTGEVETVYTHVDGHQLRGPNDLVFDGTGGFWFTDHGKNRSRERDRGGLYYAQADGSAITEVVYPLGAPNGVGLSPDGDRVYVAETYEGRLYSWTLEAPGRLKDYFGAEHRGDLVADPEGGALFDSLAVDAAGNVCVASIRHAGITVVEPGGAAHLVPFPDPLTTNICFGGPDRRTAFVTLSATGQVVSCPWPTAGLALAHT